MCITGYALFIEIPLSCLPALPACDTTYMHTNTHTQTHMYINTHTHTYTNILIITAIHTYTRVHDYIKYYLLPGYILLVIDILNYFLCQRLISFIRSQVYSYIRKRNIIIISWFSINDTKDYNSRFIIISYIVL